MSTATITPGQWEFAFGTGSSAFYIEANISSNASDSYFSSAGNTHLISASQFYAPVVGDGLGVGECGNWTLDLYVSGGSLGSTSALTSPGSTPPNNTYSLSGMIASDGNSISNGTSTLPSTICGSFSVPTTSFSAYLVSPINGTFTGTLAASNGYQDQITAQVAEANLSLSGSGTSLENGVVSNFTFSGTGSTSVATCGGTYSNVIGATFLVCGTTTDMSGTSEWAGIGRYNQAGTQAYIKTYNTQTGVSETGNITKQ